MEQNVYKMYTKLRQKTGSCGTVGKVIYYIVVPVVVLAGIASMRAALQAAVRRMPGYGGVRHGRLSYHGGVTAITAMAMDGVPGGSCRPP